MSVAGRPMRGFASAWPRVLWLGTLLIAPSALAAGDPDAGAATAMRWCTSCHVVRQLDGGPVVEGPPTFQWMARERTPDALRTFLAHPHDPMPPLELSRADIENLIAYLETLR